ncbi:MAG: ribulose-phosphate 3-epimerase [Saccharofermentans sp.]|nr:ribulose-phosphate 3-epimerase [Saccharofermentans sp.]
MNNEVKTVPSILSADFANLERDLKKIESECESVHIDIMDGHYVPNLSIGVPVVKSIRKVTGMTFDTHLMITNPEDFVEPFAKAGSDMITFHIECTKEPEALIKKIRSLGLKAGVAIHPDTDIKVLEPFCRKDATDLILVMSVNPGFGEQSFMEGAYDRISAVRKMLDDNGSSALLAVDGGVRKDNIAKVAASGARHIVAGSAVFKSEDPAATVRDLNKIGNDSIR